MTQEKQLGMTKLIQGAVEQLTPSQKILIEKHPLNGAISLEAQGQYSNEIIRIVKEHHERIDGSGSPYQLKGDEISPLAQVVGFADWCINFQYRIKQLNRDPKRELREALAYLKEFDPKHIDVAFSVFGFEPFQNKKFSA